MESPNPSISAEIRDKFETVRVARLATVDAAHTPHAIPVCFCFDGSVFYSAIDRKPKRVPADQLTRLKNIAQSPQVALLLDHYDEDWSRLWYVLVRGKAKLVSGEPERRQAIARLRTKYPQYTATMLSDDAPILRITPERITSWGRLES
jgi:PPOX class probable F420-dependent enzyme